MPPAQVAAGVARLAVDASTGSITTKQLRAWKVCPGAGIADIGICAAILKVRDPPGGSESCARQENGSDVGSGEQPSAGRAWSMRIAPAGAPGITMLSASATLPSNVVRPVLVIVIWKVQVAPAMQVAGAVLVILRSLPVSAHSFPFVQLTQLRTRHAGTAARRETSISTSTSSGRFGCSSAAGTVQVRELVGTAVQVTPGLLGVALKIGTAPVPPARSCARSTNWNWVCGAAVPALVTVMRQEARCAVGAGEQVLATRMSGWPAGGAGRGVGAGCPPPAMRWPHAV